MSGFVSLVGAGPGDGELITVKGLRRLRAADVVVYDALANPELLAECRAEALLIAAGKRGGQASASQEWINQQLVDHGRAGKNVVRLKGGDPFVFGRGGEEAEALSAAGVAWEVVPGVTSAVSVPAYAGIPVTHRELSRSFTVITGHENPAQPDTRINWQALAQIGGTLVFLMGLGRVGAIADQLTAHGMAASTPAAIISQGTQAGQRSVAATLATIASVAEHAQLAAPAVLVVGEVVQLHSLLEWVREAS